MSHSQILGTKDYKCLQLIIDHKNYTLSVNRKTSTRRVMEFERPEGSLYPKIFNSFEAKFKDCDKVEEYFIQDLTEEYFDRAVDFIVENHAKGGVLHRASNTLSSENGLMNVRQKYRSIFEEKVSLICFKSGSQEIAGLNALCIKTKENFIIPSVKIFDQN